MVNWEEQLNPNGIYYILLTDNTGKRYQKQFWLRKIIGPNAETTDFAAKRGTFYEKAPEDKQPNNNSIIGLVSLEKSDNVVYSLDVQMNDVMSLSCKEVKLLLAVSTDVERRNAALSGKEFMRACQADLGDVVLVKPEFRDTEQDMKYGIIKDIGPLKKASGVYFYVTFKVGSVISFALKNY